MLNIRHKSIIMNLGGIHAYPDLGKLPHQSKEVVNLPKIGIEVSATGCPFRTVWSGDTWTPLPPRMASHFHCYCLEDSYDVLLNFGGPQGIEPIEEVLGNFYKMLKRLWEPGFYLEFCAQGSESVSPFHLFHLFIDWSELVGSLVFVCLLGLSVWCFSFASLCCWPIFAIELSTHDYFSTASWLPQL